VKNSEQLLKQFRSEVERLNEGISRRIELETRNCPKWLRLWGKKPNTRFML
jgi:hypothetical protein